MGGEGEKKREAMSEASSGRRRRDGRKPHECARLLPSFLHLSAHDTFSSQGLPAFILPACGKKLSASLHPSLNCLPPWLVWQRLPPPCHSTLQSCYGTSLPRRPPGDSFLCVSAAGEPFLFVLISRAYVDDAPLLLAATKQTGAGRTQGRDRLKSRRVRGAARGQQPRSEAVMVGAALTRMQAGRKVGRQPSRHALTLLRFAPGRRRTRSPGPNLKRPEKMNP